MQLMENPRFSLKPETLNSEFPPIRSLQQLFRIPARHVGGAPSAAGAKRLLQQHLVDT
jgi:hypothetical protein